MLLLVTVTEQNFDWSLLVQRRWGWFTSRFTYYTADNTFFFREHHNRKITTVLSVTDKRHVYDYTVFQPAAYKNRLCNANNCEIDSPHLLWGRVLPLNRGLTMYPAKARLLGGFGNGPRKKKKMTTRVHSWPRSDEKFAACPAGVRTVTVAVAGRSRADEHKFPAQISQPAWNKYINVRGD